MVHPPATAGGTDPFQVQIPTFEVKRRRGECESVLIHGDTVIVMGREIVVPKGNSPDAGQTINRRYTNIWMKRSGKWRLVARHASVICQK